jgi:hypothetical protein
MNRLFLLCVLTTTLANFAHASGLGWGVQSFEWKKYEADKTQIDASVKKCITQSDEEPRWCGEREIVARFIGVRGQQATSIAKYDVKNVVLPLNFEYFSVPFLSEAYELQSKNNLVTLFGLFKNGRSEWKDQWTGCEAHPEMSWNCTNAYVLMRPNEVQKFKQEVDSLIGKKTFVKYEYFRQDLSVLKAVLDITAKENRALLFYAQD